MNSCTSPTDSTERFKSLLNEQINLDGDFDYLHKHLGEEIVNCLPTIYEISREPFVNAVTTPWEYPEDLPADVVKGVFPTHKRPFLAMRYIDKKTDDYVIEVFYNMNGRGLDQTQSINPVWVSISTGPPNSKICKNEMTDEIFSIIKHMMHGADLELTGGRYLTMYEQSFVNPQKFNLK